MGEEADIGQHPGLQGHQAPEGRQVPVFNNSIFINAQGLLHGDLSRYRGMDTEPCQGNKENAEADPSRGGYEHFASWVTPNPGVFNYK
jgi:hypothetical protein